MRSLRGKLLIAGGSLLDPNFRRTVVLVADHDDHGAAGVVLNRPTEVPVEDGAPGLAPLVPPGEVLFGGGPVQPEAAVVVVEFEVPDLAQRLVFGRVGLLTGEETTSAREAILRARVFAGYAGWGRGQLEAELEEEAWIVEEPRIEDVFTRDPERLWSSILRRSGSSTLAMLSLMPEDPSQN